MRIFDNPNHPHYGPVRRLWIILAQLELLSWADQVTVRFLCDGRAWDEEIARALDRGESEVVAHRAMLQLLLS